jgi:hypothetical protein
MPTFTRRPGVRVTAPAELLLRAPLTCACLLALLTPARAAPAQAAGLAGTVEVTALAGRAPSGSGRASAA